MTSEQDVRNRNRTLLIEVWMRTVNRLPALTIADGVSKHHGDETVRSARAREEAAGGGAEGRIRAVSSGWRAIARRRPGFRLQSAGNALKPVAVSPGQVFSIVRP